jgi:hypothetical protein
MPVSSTTSRADYNGNGATTLFVVPFYFLLNTDIQVILTDDGVSPVSVTTLALTTDYTVGGVANPAGGSITCTVAPTATQRISILRSVPYTQLKNYVPNDPFPAASHEQALDKLTMEIQQLAEVQSRALTLSANTDPNTVSPVLPTPESNKLIGWNEAADALQNVDPATMATIVAFGTANSDLFSGNGVQTAFALTANPGAQANLDVAISGVTQRPGIDYTWGGGTTLTFAVAPPAGVNNILARYMQGLPQGASDLDATLFTQAGVGAVPRSAQGKMRERVSVLDYGAFGDGTTDDTPAFAAAVQYLVGLGGGTLYAPRGTYLLNGSTGADAFKNGVLLPDTNGSFTDRRGILIEGDGPETLLLAGSTDMIVVRSSRLWSGCRNLKISGGGLANVWGAGIVPESITQTTELVSNSYQRWRNVLIESATEGLVLQPGPTVLGADSGCFYHDIDITTNLCTRGVWLKSDVTGMNNRITRSRIRVKTLRGNTGVQVDYGSELELEVYAEIISSGVTPNASPVAVLTSANNLANINLRGYAEACTRGLVALKPEVVDDTHWEQSMVRDASMAFTNHANQNRWNMAKLLNVPAVLSAGNPSFTALVTDPDGNESKALEVQTNGARRMRWFNGETIHSGSLGTVTISAGGGDFAWSYAGNVSFSFANGASVINAADSQYWRSAAGVDAVRIATTGTRSLFPATDNTIVLGQNGLRWSAVWAANGTIQTSDPRTKKDVEDSVLGLDFIKALRPVSYRFIVGGNEITGTREISPAVMGVDDDGKPVVLVPAETENVFQPVPGKRKHFGFLTTNVKEAAGGVDFGGYIKTDPSNPESEEALRYDEFIAPLVKAVQELAAELAALKLKIGA